MPQINIKQAKGATQGSVLFLGSNGTISENNGKLNWDNSNYRFGIGTVSSSDTFAVYRDTFGSGNLGFSVNFPSPIGKAFYVNDVGRAVVDSAAGLRVVGSNALIQLWSNGGIAPEIDWYYNNGSSFQGSLYGQNNSMFFGLPDSTLGLGVGAYYYTPSGMLSVRGVTSGNALRVESFQGSTIINAANSGGVSIGTSSMFGTERLRVYGNQRIDGDLFVTGSFSVFGSASVINTQNTLIQDPIILLASTQSGAPVLDSGFFINRGTGATYAFIWDESADEFSVIQTNDSSYVIGNVNIGSGADIRSLNYKFFDTGAPSSPSSAYINAPNGSSLGLNAAGNIFVNTPSISSSAQDTAWGIGSNTLNFNGVGRSFTIGYIDSGSNIPTFQFNSSSGGGSSLFRTGLSFSHIIGSQIDQVLERGFVIEVRDSGTYSGTAVGLSIDVTGVTNSNRLKYGLRIVDGKQANGYVLVSDSNGFASWTSSSSLPVNINANNGLTYSGGYVQLGGSLIQSTTISGSYLYDLNINSIKNISISGSGSTYRLSHNNGNTIEMNDSNYLSLTTDNNGFAQSWISMTPGTLDINAGGASGYLSIAIQNGNAVLSSSGGGNAVLSAVGSVSPTRRVELSTAGGNSILMYLATQSIPNNGVNNTLIIQDNVTSKGLVYTADYSSNFTPESLVSKRYVDTIAVTGSGVTNYVPRWLSAQQLSATGSIYDDGTNVGIGTLTPATKLHVTAPSSGTVDIVAVRPYQYGGGIYLSSTSTDNPRIYLQSTASATTIVFDADGNSYFNGGNVGIGSTSPSVKLHVIGDASTDVIAMRPSLYGGGIYQSISGSSNPFLYMQSTASATTVYLNSNGDSFFNSGNFGIGTLSPTNKLHIVDGSGLGGFRLQDGFEASGYVLTCDATGVGTWQPSTGGGGATGSTNSVPYWITNTQLAPGSIYDDGTQIGVGTVSNASYRVSISGDVNITGTLYATSKSFEIEHPLDPKKRLTYGSLEGPEYGVYFRGRLENESVINLPDYWTGLVDESTITVNLTPIGVHQRLYVDKIENNRVYVCGNDTHTNCYYIVYAERKDIPKIIVE